ncbi:MAG: hypothetical protein HYT12_00365 [Candidatus Liptonbacteria bacterium]|nr:hypothetical protein [Candidatus Liptonbacteria bacterium]
MEHIYIPRFRPYNLGGLQIRNYRCDKHTWAGVPLLFENSGSRLAAQESLEESKKCDDCKVQRKCQEAIDQEDTADEKRQREYEQERSKHMTFRNRFMCFFLRHKYEIVGIFSDGDPINDCARCGNRTFRIFTEPSKAEMLEFYNITNS